MVLWYSMFHSVSYEVIGWMGFIKCSGLIPNMRSTYCSPLSQTALQLTGSAQKALYDVHLTCGEEQRSHRDWLHCSTSSLPFVLSESLCPQPGEWTLAGRAPVARPKGDLGKDPSLGSSKADATCAKQVTQLTKRGQVFNQITEGY